MSDFSTVLIEDNRIASITSEEAFGVNSGAAQVTAQQFAAISASNSSIVFNVQIASENIVIDRHLLIQSQIVYTLCVTDVPAGDKAMSYGQTDSFQAFPLNSLFTTIQSTINNASVSTNLQDILPMVMRMNDNRVLSRYNSTTPSYPDQQYAEYATGALANNNPLAGYTNNSYDSDFLPRGAYPLDSIYVQHNITGGGVDASLISTDPLDTFKIVLTITVTEPFLALSPFINCQPSCNEAGLLGVNNMSIVCNIDSGARRLFSTMNAAYNYTGSGLGNLSNQAGANPNGFLSTKLLFTFLSLQPEMYAKLSTKNIVSFLDYPRYLSLANNTTVVPANGAATVKLTSQSLQLNQVPDLIIITVRKPMSTQTIKDTSSFLALSPDNPISFNFNNSSGILSTYSIQQLYELSVKNGSSQTFQEFSGFAQIPDNATGGVTRVGTTGAMLVINPALDFGLPDYLSSSSLGQYQLQFNINVINQYTTDVTPEICIITMNSGLFATQQGTSQVFTGILTKEQVLNTKQQSPVPALDTSEYARMVGGKLQNRGMGNLLNFVKKMKDKHKSGGTGFSGGVGSSGGGMSGGVGSSGGSLKSRIKSRVSKHLV